MTALLNGTIMSGSVTSWAKALKDAGYKVIAPVRRGEEVEYQEWNEGPIALNDGLPKLSPKQAWFPRTEPVLNLTREGKTWKVDDTQMEFPKVVILGARPCDASAMDIQKDLFGWDFDDPFFRKRSQNVFFVAAGCTKPVDGACFCASVNKLRPTGEGIGEVTLTPLEDGSFYALANNEKGQELLKLAGTLGDAPSLDTIEKIRNNAYMDVMATKHFTPDRVRKAIEANFENEIWDKTSQGCVSCGTCAFSCPTCHCFDIQDEMTGVKGLRQKNWDACTFPLFTLHTSGHNPRSTKASRWRQRVSHKFQIYPQKFNKVLCTGCGRCIRLCPGGLDLLDTLRRLDDMAENDGHVCTCKSLTLDSPGVKASNPGESENLYHPYPMKVASIKDETNDVRTLRLAFADPKDAEKFTFKVGQFGLYSALGEGESTFCVASSPKQKDYIECTFRQAGRVTKALRMLQVGDELGFRGPYGNSFPVDQWKGKNVVFIGGGIGVAPVRAVLQYCIDTRENFNKLTVVFGAKTWADHCYKSEMPLWQEVPNLDLYLGIDWTFGPNGPQRDKAALEGWDPLVPGQKPKGKTTCFVPELVEAAAPDPTNTVAVVCGPPIMINLSVKVLEKLGFAKDSIYATLENRMKCGVGKCGRCNVGSVYVCKEGPVFTAEQLSLLPNDT